MSTAQTTRTDPCKGCGKPVTRDIPQGQDSISSLIRRIGAWCDECDKKARQEMVEEDRANRERERRSEFELRVRQSGLPKSHHGKSVRDLQHPERVLKAAEDWASGGGGLLLTGEIGRGKTTLAGAAAWERLQRKSVIWTSAPLLLARLGTGLGTEQREWAIGLLANAQALVLDDIDKARPTEYGAEQVFLAVDQRVEHNAPLLVTTNLSPSQLAERWPEPFGPAIASRLVGYCTVVKVDGADRRLRPVGS